MPVTPRAAFHRRFFAVISYLLIPPFSHLPPDADYRRFTIIAVTFITIIFTPITPSLIIPIISV